MFVHPNCGNIGLFTGNFSAGGEITLEVWRPYWKKYTCIKVTNNMDNLVNWRDFLFTHSKEYHRRKIICFSWASLLTVLCTVLYWQCINAKIKIIYTTPLIYYTYKMSYTEALREEWKICQWHFRCNSSVIRSPCNECIQNMLRMFYQSGWDYAVCRFMLIIER